MDVSSHSSVIPAVSQSSSIFSFEESKNKYLVVTALFIGCVGICYAASDYFFNNKPRTDGKGTLNGRGKRVLTGGTLLEGTFVDGKLHGAGKVTLPNTMTISGQFDHGREVGKVKIVDPDGEPWEGEIRSIDFFLDGE